MCDCSYITCGFMKECFQFSFQKTIQGKMNSEKKSIEGLHKIQRSEIATKNNSGDANSLSGKNEKVKKERPATKIIKDQRKPKFLCQRKYYEPHIPPQKSAPVHVHISNPSAEIVLREKNIEIKDLESTVMFLKKEMKTLQQDKKTLQDMHSRQERELKKFKTGVTDLPSMLKSHKHEMKAVEFNAGSLRKELSQCQRDLRTKNDLILKRDQQIEKLQTTLKRNEKQIQMSIIENKELQLSSKKYEEDCKKLFVGNEELKSKNESLIKKIQHLSSSISNWEEKLQDEGHLTDQLQERLNKLQKEYDELLKSETALKKRVQVVKNDFSSQTTPPETVSVSCMTIKPLLEKEIHSKHRVGSLKELNPLNDGGQDNKLDFHWNAEKQSKPNDFPLLFLPPEVKNVKLDRRLSQKKSLEPLPMTLFDQKQDIRYENIEAEREKGLSRENVALHPNSLANHDQILEYCHPCGTRNNQMNNESEDSEMIYYGEKEVSSSNSRTRLLKHLSNLTLK